MIIYCWGYQCETCHVLYCIVFIFYKELIQLPWLVFLFPLFNLGSRLFSSRFFPSVCSGVVAKVVEAKTPQSYQSIQPELMHMHELFPAMLETTAAVHPGASGGAVINSDGHMIGLVTSNARHGGGTIIAHLNFSIPSAALVPIFKFSKDMKDLSLLRILDEPDEYISSVWALMRPSSPKVHAMPDLPQSLVDNKSKEVKGSRCQVYR